MLPRGQHSRIYYTQYRLQGIGDVCAAAKTNDLPAICVLSERASDLDLIENSR